jgi:hypothetical protein
MRKCSRMHILKSYGCTYLAVYGSPCAPCVDMQQEKKVDGKIYALKPIRDNESIIPRLALFSKKGSEDRFIAIFALVYILFLVCLGACTNSATRWHILCMYARSVGMTHLSASTARSILAPLMPMRGSICVGALCTHA